MTIGGSTVSGNGRKSNILMYASDGTTLETQSSAFTEALKAKLQSFQSFYNNIGKIEFITNSLWWVGQVYNIINFAPSTLYQPTGYAAKKNVGEWIYAFVNSGSSLFGSNGAYLLDDKPILTLVFEMDFTAGNAAVAILCSRIIVENSAGNVVAETMNAGLYNTTRTTEYYHIM